jgi:uncharacterized protein (DUF1697 family)
MGRVVAKQARNPGVHPLARLAHAGRRARAARSIERTAEGGPCASDLVKPSRSSSMQTYIALLRGINVSGQNAIRMSQLRESMTSLGLKDVRTYLQSGNVVFRAGQSGRVALAAKVKARIAQDLAHEVPVLVLSGKALDGVVNSNPLWPRSDGEEKLLHGTFLFQPVSQGSFRALKLPASADERAVLVGRVVMLYCPDGYGKTKLTNSYFERALGVLATTRNWRTVLALQELCAKP